MLSGSMPRARSANVRASRLVAALQRDAGQAGHGDGVGGVEFDQLPVGPLGLVEQTGRQGLVGLEQQLEHQPVSWEDFTSRILHQPAIDDRLSRQVEQDRPIVERRLGDDALRQVVEQPPEFAARAAGPAPHQVVAVDRQLVPAEDDVAGQLGSDPRRQLGQAAGVGGLAAALVVGRAKSEQVVHRSRGRPFG